MTKTKSAAAQYACCRWVSTACWHNAAQSKNEAVWGGEHTYDACDSWPEGQLALFNQVHEDVSFEKVHLLHKCHSIFHALQQCIISPVVVPGMTPTTVSFFCFFSLHDKQDIVNQNM